MRESRKERNAPVVIEEFPTDVSVYGVRGLGGNMCDWTSTEVTQGTGPRLRARRVDRGGSWSYGGRYCRAANRDWHEPMRCTGLLGLRLARSIQARAL